MPGWNGKSPSDVMREDPGILCMPCSFAGTEIRAQHYASTAEQLPSYVPGLIQFLCDACFNDHHDGEFHATPHMNYDGTPSPGVD